MTNILLLAHKNYVFFIKMRAKKVKFIYYGVQLMITNLYFYFKSTLYW